MKTNRERATATQQAEWARQIHSGLFVWLDLYTFVGFVWLGNFDYIVDLVDFMPDGWFCSFGLADIFSSDERLKK